jgi:hypothetical protein
MSDPIVVDLTKDGEVTERKIVNGLEAIAIAWRVHQYPVQEYWDADRRRRVADKERLNRESRRYQEETECKKVTA